VGPLDGWVQTLATVVLLAGVAVALVPEGGYRPLVRSLLSLLVLGVLLRPVLAVVQGRVDWQVLWRAAAVAGAPAPTAVGAAQQAAYERVLAQAAAGLVQGLPGVQDAQVDLRFADAPGASEPPVADATVVVTPAARPPADLAAEVRAQLAPALGLPAARVQVTVL
jgi:hypothetical protein